MRIISQDGTIDVNYDLGNLSIAKGAGNRENDRSIYFHSCSSARGTKLATYSTAEKAKKAIEMLHEKYREINVYLFNSKQDMIPPKVFKFPSEYEVDKALNEIEE